MTVLFEGVQSLRNPLIGSMGRADAPRWGGQPAIQGLHVLAGTHSHETKESKVHEKKAKDKDQVSKTTDSKKEDKAKK